MGLTCPKVMIFSRTGTCEVSSGSDQTLASLDSFVHLHPSLSCFRPKIKKMDAECEFNMWTFAARGGCQVWMVRFWTSFCAKARRCQLNTVAFGCLKLSCHLAASL